jgi:glycerol-3-phosphate dehydrogenase (NAD(P)+)
VAVSPSHVTRQVMKDAVPFLDADATVVCATKGIEIDQLKLMCEVMDEVLPEPNRARAAYLSGPSFAKEMVQKLPTAVTVASLHPEIGQRVQQAFNSDYFRVYTVEDVIGVEVAGAAKNVMAIAAGISDGLGFGHNTRAAIISRGLAEMSRLGIRLGGHAITFMGLAGVGDLVLTCTGDLSRNRTVGLKLGAGKTLEEILTEMNQVAEGVNTAKALHGLSARLGVDMPIVEAVYQILYEGKSPRRAVSELMGRPLKKELG